MENKDKLDVNKPIPDLPDDIIETIEMNNIILFVGAGISMQLGYPSWRGLGEELVKRCGECINKNTNSPIMNSMEQSTLLNSGFSALQLVTIASHRLDSGGYSGLDAICDILGKPITDEYTKIKRDKIASCLASFKCPIITTNADLSLDDSGYFDENIYHSLTDSAKEIDTIGILHVHGSIKERENMIFTAQQYAKSYTQQMTLDAD